MLLVTDYTHVNELGVTVSNVDEGPLLMQKSPLALTAIQLDSKVLEFGLQFELGKLVAANRDSGVESGNGLVLFGAGIAAFEKQQATVLTSTIIGGAV